MEILSHNENETTEAARALAARLAAPQCIFLQGPLGSGKSLFARALIRALTGNPDEEVPSPTFTLVQNYDTPAGTIWHFDLYRLNNPEDVYELGWEDAVSEGIALVEWPERLAGLLPRNYMLIEFFAVGGQPDHRRICITEKGKVKP